MDYSKLVTASKAAVMLIVSAILGMIIDYATGSLGITLPPEYRDKIIAGVSVALGAAIYTSAKNVAKNAAGLELPKWI